MARIRTLTSRRNTGPLSERGATKAIPLGCTLLFGLFFFLPGLGVAGFLGVRPLLQVLAAQQWTATPATVLASEVKSSSSSDGNTYSVHIEYRYAWIESTYTSSRYDFVTGSSSGYKNKQRIVDQHPVGSTITAWVNPNNPAEAVIDRSVKLFYFGMIAFGGVFMLVGGGVMVMSFVGRKKAGEPPPPLSSTAGSRVDSIPARRVTDASGTLVLTPSAGPWMKALGALFIALFWNGIVSVFLFQVVKSFQKGRPEWILVLFLIPFVVVGLLMIVGFFHALLATLNPRVLLLIGPGNLRCGGRFTLDWEFVGSTHRLRDFSLVLEGVEKATYRQGTDTRTDEHVFHRTTLARREAGQPMENGSVALDFPAGLIHSFQASHNRIEWRLVVRGDIPKWPDLNETYPITLLPADSSRA